MRLGSEMRGSPSKAFARSPGPILQAQPAPWTVSVRRSLFASAIWFTTFSIFGYVRANLCARPCPRNRADTLYTIVGRLEHQKSVGFRCATPILSSLPGGGELESNQPQHVRQCRSRFCRPRGTRLHRPRSLIPLYFPEGLIWSLYPSGTCSTLTEYPLLCASRETFSLEAAVSTSTVSGWPGFSSIAFFVLTTGMGQE